MKKLTAILLALALLFGLAGCLSQEDLDNAVNDATKPLKEQIAQLNADIAAKEATIETLESEKADLTEEKTELEEEIDEIDAQIETLNGKVAELEASGEADEAEINKLKGDISALEEKKTELGDKVTELEASISAKDTEIADLNSSIDTLKADKQALSNQIATLEKEKDELEKENEALKNCLKGNHAYTYTDNEDGTHDKVCSACGYVEVDNEAHAYTYTNNGDGTHDKACSACGYVEVDNEEHTYIEDGICACGLIDATGMTAESLNTTVAKVLAEGKTDITVSLAANAPAEMFTAIRRALIDTEGVADGSIHLTLAGVTAIPDHIDNPFDASWIFGSRHHNEEGGLIPSEIVTQLASVNLPDVLTIGEKAFESCQYLTALTAPKVQTISKYAFHSTGLTSINLPEATTLEEGAFLNCSDIIEFNLPKVTVLGRVALDIDYWGLNTYDSERTIYLTSSDEIAVEVDCFQDLANAGLLETHVNLVLNSNKKSEVSGNTWTTKDANGNTVTFTFKSITFVD